VYIFDLNLIIYSSKKVKDHYCVAVFWKTSPTDFVNIVEQCLLMMLISLLRYWFKTCVVVKKRFKDCCAQKHDRLGGASLLVRVGSPMIVLRTCMPSLKKIWLNPTIEMRSMRHMWPLYWCCGPILCGYGRKRPSVSGLFCQRVHWARKE